MSAWEPLTIPCETDVLAAILHRGAAAAKHGLVIVVGGPQNRFGSHRQFVLLARTLAATGIPVLRFDFRGMGDSTGEPRGFERVDVEIRVAIDAFFNQEPALRDITLLGLCDGASAALLYAPGDTRVGALVLLNPWARSAASHARARLSKYYWRRLTSRDFWRRLLTGKVRLADSAREVGGYVASARYAAQPQGSFTDRMAQAIGKFSGRTLVVLSGRDVTADEFRSWCNSSRAIAKAWSGERIDFLEMAAADHTFSSASLRDALAERVVAWVSSSQGRG